MALVRNETLAFQILGEGGNAGRRQAFIAGYVPLLIAGRPDSAPPQSGGGEMRRKAFAIDGAHDVQEVALRQRLQPDPGRFEDCFAGKGRPVFWKVRHGASRFRDR